MTEREARGGDLVLHPQLDDYEAMTTPEKCGLLLERLNGLFEEPNDLHHTVQQVELAAGLIEDPAERTGWLNLPLAVCAVRPVSDYVGLRTKYAAGNFSYHRTLIAHIKSGFVHDITWRSDGEAVHPPLDEQDKPDQLAYMLACLDRLASHSQPLTTEEVKTVYTYK